MLNEIRVVGPGVAAQRMRTAQARAAFMISSRPVIARMQLYIKEEKRDVGIVSMEVRGRRELSVPYEARRECFYLVRAINSLISISVVKITFFFSKATWLAFDIDRSLAMTVLKKLHTWN
ncbi:hypothetical protein EVAR_77018_1 [Eumeta japonica]|uniref:Uncharacterized protein n=1 Tax=Eumeta variegata TaxID=151549 RepID=A0A4C1SI73_EUMVA|nr:hypothetical protein EVAR_77018_1 [Eumeta japonica]